MLSRFVSLKALIVGLVIGIAGAGAAFALAQSGGGTGSSPQASASSPGAPTTKNSASEQQTSTSSCQLPDQIAQEVAAGGITQHDACEGVKAGEAAEAARQAAGNPTGPGENNLEIDGAPLPRMVDQCRAGASVSDEGPAADALYCNAILNIAAGELKPTGSTPDGRPVWSYSEAELRGLPSN